MNRLRQFTEQLLSDGYSVTELQHAFRINGCIDLYKNGRTIFDKNTKEYKSVDYYDDGIEYVKQILVGTTKVPDFKKAKHGMTWQEYKHQKDLIADSSHAEDYHWRINDTLSDSDLYIVFHRDTAKIGKSNNVKRRIKQLQTALSHDIEIYIFKGKGHVEKTLHWVFSEFKTNREWFRAEYRIFRFAKKYGQLLK